MFYAIIQNIGAIPKVSASCNKNLKMFILCLLGTVKFLIEIAFHGHIKLRGSAPMANKNHFYVWLGYTFPVVPAIATLTFNLKKTVTSL